MFKKMLSIVIVSLLMHTSVVSVFAQQNVKTKSDVARYIAESEKRGATEKAQVKKGLSKRAKIGIGIAVALGAAAVAGAVGTKGGAVKFR